MAVAATSPRALAAAAQTRAAGPSVPRHRLQLELAERRGRLAVRARARGMAGSTRRARGALSGGERRRRRANRHSPSATLRSARSACLGRARTERRRHGPRNAQLLAGRRRNAVEHLRARWLASSEYARADRFFDSRLLLRLLLVHRRVERPRRARLSSLQDGLCRANGSRVARRDPGAGLPLAAGRRRASSCDGDRARGRAPSATGLGLRWVARALDRCVRAPPERARLAAERVAGSSRLRRA